MKFEKIICIVFIFLVGTALFATEFGDKVYMEVEIDGDKVGKWVTFCAIREYDVNGGLIYDNTLNRETRYECDKYGSTIYEKLPDGSETWFEPKYDKNNKLIYRKSSTGQEEWFEYDKNGNNIHYKKFDGLETWKEYDSKGNCIHEKRSDGMEYWSKHYKTGGNAYYITDTNGLFVWIDKYEYWEDGKTPKKIMIYAYNKH